MLRKKLPQPCVAVYKNSAHVMSLNLTVDTPAGGSTLRSIARGQRFTQAVHYNLAMGFSELIRGEAAKLQRLHAAVHETFPHRERDARSRQEWLDAAKAFHARESAIDGYLERACSEKRYFDREILEFVICFLEIDPWFFGSGFVKQELITRLKRSTLSGPAKERLRAVLVDAVNRRGTREFKYYCRLAVPLATPELLSQLQLASASIDRARASRARMMLKYIAHSPVGKLMPQVV